MNHDALQLTLAIATAHKARRLLAPHKVRYRLGDRLRRLGPVTVKTLAFPGPTGSSASPWS